MNFLVSPLLISALSPYHPHATSYLLVEPQTAFQPISLSAVDVSLPAELKEPEIHPMLSLAFATKEQVPMMIPKLGPLMVAGVLSCWERPQTLHRAKEHP